MFGVNVGCSSFFIFTLSNVLIAFYLGNLRQYFTLLSCSTIKSVTVGTLVASSITLGLFAVMYVETPEKKPHMALYIFTLIPMMALGLYIVKEHSFTFPFIRGQLVKAHGYLTCRHTPVVLFAQPSGDNLSTAHPVISRISGGNVFRVPDNGGGVYMGPVLPNMAVPT